jgi:hypothetical protein
MEKKCWKKKVAGVFIGLAILVLCVFVGTGRTQDRDEPAQTGLPDHNWAVKTEAEPESTGYPDQRKLAITSDGHLHVIYHRKDGNSILQIYHAESADGGRTWVEEQVTNAARDQNFPSLAVDSKDNLHVVWEDGTHSKPQTVPYTYYNKKTAEGWQAAELVASYATAPSIAVDSNDDVYVAYGAYVYTPGYYGGGDGIRWRKRTSAGWQAEEIVSSINKYWERWPAIAIDGNNDVHVVWEHAPRSRYYDVHYRKRTSSGWGTEVEINTDKYNEIGSEPSIAIDSDNYIHIVWQHLSVGYYSIKYLKYTTSWQPTEGLVGPTTYVQLYPTIATDGKDNIHVVWSGQHSGSPTICQIRYRKHTTLWQPIEDLTSSTVNNQTCPNLMWALHPTVNGVKTNRPEDGYSFVWTDDTTIKYWVGGEAPPPPEEWSFAIITDLHIGRGYPEYNGEDYYLKERLEKVVDWINANRKNEKIKFLVVLGDIADNSEYSKLAKAKQILDRLEEIPYFPVLGNHDVWSDGKANGDSNFNEIFDETFFRDSATKLGTKWRNGRTIERLGGVLVDEDSYLQNYAFVYNDVTFVALDFVARTKPLRVLPVGNPVAVGHESTMQWLNMCLAIGKPTILLSHHPMAEKGLIEVEGYGVIDYAFNYSDVIRIGDIIWGSGTEVLANFAGHLHGWSTKFLNILRHTPFMDANKDYKEDGYFTPYGIRAVVTTEAVMVASNDPTEPYVIGSNYPTPKGTEKGVIRIVKMRGNEIVLPSLVEGFFPALNPSFDAGWPDLSLAGVGLHFLRKTPIKFEAYAFTKMFTQEHPLTYVMNFGDSQAEPKSATGGEVPFEHTYDNGGKYNVTLLVKGQTPEGEIIREEITQEINVSDFGIFGLSPIDIIVTDPDGLTISKQLNQIPEAIYTETDFNGDGDPDDVILIPHRKIGNYVITVIPEPGAAPTDTYTLEVLVDGVSILLADKVQISNIPALPYVIRATETGVIPIIPATVDFDPDTLNLKSKGQWVTVYIELPVGHGYAVSQLDVSSIRLNGQVHAEAKPTKVGDYDKDGIPDLMVKFDRAAVQAILQVGDNVEITVNGSLLDSRQFEGKDSIRVKN